jgi:dTMP kinase
VVLDRFVDSSLAYQGEGRGLGMQAIREVNEFATGGLRPDRTLLLTIDPAAGRARTTGRGEAPDRLEREQDEFFERIEAAYRTLAASEPERIRAINADAPPAAVLAAALEAVADLL